MELKLDGSITIGPFPVSLLIVPYGIETPLDRFVSDTSFCLLIVPYGIETVDHEVYTHLPTKLLIVPYGIETLKEHNLFEY